eukprot:GHVN01026729.1.p2 GENE.GHVN01026729.1~~GHVN01026729.1.p2  ORF type:complete len:103 (-),score=6.55 GHVN01026729.1:438-746(-)
MRRLIRNTSSHNRWASTRTGQSHGINRILTDSGLSSEERNKITWHSGKVALLKWIADDGATYRASRLQGHQADDRTADLYARLSLAVAVEASRQRHGDTSFR